MSALTPHRVYLVRCACGCFKSDVVDVHAPRWVKRDGKPVLVDCLGKPIQR